MSSQIAPDQVASISSIIYCAETAWNCSGTCPSQSSTSKHLANVKEMIQPARLGTRVAGRSFSAKGVVAALSRGGRALYTLHHPKLRPEALSQGPKARNSSVAACINGSNDVKVEIQNGDPTCVQLSRGEGHGESCSTSASLANRTRRSSCFLS